MNNQIPKGWTLEEFANIVSNMADGGTPSTAITEYFNGDIAWVVIEDIKRKITKTENTLTELGLKRSSAKLWDIGSVILSTGATIGKIGIAEIPLSTKQGIIGITCNEKILNYFLYYVLQQNEELLHRYAQGSTIKEIRIPILSKLRFLTPPIQEQKKIAAILTSVDEVIENTQAQIAKFEDLKRATMKELLTNGIGHTEFKETEIGRIPKSWDLKKSSEICERIMVGVVVTPSKYYATSGVPVLRSANVKEGFLTSENLKFFSYESNQILKKSILQEGDLVSVRTGYPGTTAVVDKRFVGGNCVDLIVSRPSTQIRSEYLAMWINSDFGRGQVLKRQGGLAQQHFNVGDMHDLMVAVPPTNEQLQIENSIGTINIQLKLKREILSSYKALKKALMQDLLTGKVRVSVN